MKTLRILAALVLVAGFAADASAQAKKPNIIVILADDIGFGDLGCYGATRVKTPNCDRLASQGLRFRDAHSSSATCTPSRYSLLTGQYAWRHRPAAGILPGDAALAIPLDRPTLPSLLRSLGYKTGIVGKWHLGLGTGPIDWNAEVKPGPREVGFDWSFIFPATGDRVPCVYMENQKVVGLDPSDPIKVDYKKKIGAEPTGKENPDKLKMKLSQGHDATIINGISRIGWMTGGKAARWNDENMADDLTKKAIEFVEREKDGPFFLYFATHDIHVPRVPHPRFVAKSGCGIRGDAIEQFDECVGRLLAVLDKLGIADNTIVVVTSDNGPVVNDGYADGSVVNLNGHRPAGPWSGGKYSLLEGGTRLPFIIRWPGKTKPGESDQPICQVDLTATFVRIAGGTLPKRAAPDSFDLTPIFLGEAKAPIRDHLIYHTSPLALREGPWVVMPAQIKGQATYKGGPALYNLERDPEEKTNLAAQEPRRLEEMTARLQRLVDAGKTRPD